MLGAEPAAVSVPVGTDCRVLACDRAVLDLSDVSKVKHRVRFGSSKQGHLALLHQLKLSHTGNHIFLDFFVLNLQETAPAAGGVDFPEQERPLRPCPPKTVTGVPGV